MLTIILVLYQHLIILNNIDNLAKISLNEQINNLVSMITFLQSKILEK